MSSSTHGVQADARVAPASVLDLACWALIWARDARPGPLRWAVLRPRRPICALVDPSDAAVPAGSSLAASGPARLKIMAVVLGSYSRRDDDLPDVGPHRSGWTVVFRKPPPANSTGRPMPGDCWIGWYSIVRTHVLLWPFGFRGSVSKLRWLFFHGARFLVPWCWRRMS